MVNDDAKLQAALSPANAGVHEVKDFKNMHANIFCWTLFYK